MTGSGLTENEIRVLRLVRQLGSQAAAAERLDKSPSTISRTVTRAREKYEECVELIEQVRKEGWFAGQDAAPETRRRRR